MYDYISLSKVFFYFIWPLKAQREKVVTNNLLVAHKDNY